MLQLATRGRPEYFHLSLSKWMKPEYLRNCVTPERDVLEWVVRDVHGDNIHKPLNFMEDCICKGQGFPVFHTRTALLSNHSRNLLLHGLLKWEKKKKRGSLTGATMVEQLVDWFISKSANKTYFDSLSCGKNIHSHGQDLYYLKVKLSPKCNLGFHCECKQVCPPCYVAFWEDDWERNK